MFEPRSISSSYSVIVRVRVVLKRTAVDDWRFDNLNGSHQSSESSEYCLLFNDVIKSSPLNVIGSSFCLMGLTMAAFSDISCLRITCNHRHLKSDKFMHWFYPMTNVISFIYRHKCFTGKYTTRKIHTKLHPGLEGRIFHILTSEDIDDFTDIKFVS